MTNFVGLGERSVSIVGRSILCTWLIESIQVAPALAIVGISAGNELLRLLHCLCRHGLRLSGVNPAALCSLPSGMTCGKRTTCHFLHSPDKDKALKIGIELEIRYVGVTVDQQVKKPVHVARDELTHGILIARISHRNVSSPPL